MPHARNANDFIEEQLNIAIGEIESSFSGDVLSFCGGLLFGVDDAVRDAVELKKNECPGKDRLVVMLTTGGGYAEVVQRIVETFRHHYKIVDFVVPNYAFSAGTIMTMSGDAIYMDYYSRLGPIDPQVEIRGGRMVPALGYLRQYEKLMDKANAGTINMTEAQLLIEGFDQAELHQYEQARQLSITLLTDWLVKYKFKNWIETKDRKLPVTIDMKKARAADIASELNKTEKWHTHGRGISKEVLEKDLNLHIDDLASNKDRYDKVRSYHGLLADYMSKRDHNGAIHTQYHYTPFM